MSVSVGTVAQTVAEQVCAFLIYPTTRHPLPPALTRTACESSLASS